MYSLIESVNQKNQKKKVTGVRSGDTVRVYQKIKEGGKSRIQVFEGLTIATKNSGPVNATITVRRIASGVGVEKTFLLHSPLIEKVDVVKRTKVKRNKLNYMRARSGKSARLRSIVFDIDAVNKEQMESVEEQRDKEIEASENEDEATPAEDSNQEAGPSDESEEQAAEKQGEKPKPADDSGKQGGKDSGKDQEQDKKSAPSDEAPKKDSNDKK